MFIKNFLSNVFTKKLSTNVQDPIKYFIKKSGSTEINLSELNNVFTKKTSTNVQNPIKYFIKKSGSTEINLSELLANNGIKLKK